MSLPAKSQPMVRFGEFQLDFESAELRTNGNKTSLQGQPIQILAVLLENPGRLVTRDELKKRLWPSDTFVDFDQSLNRAVNRLREALSDSAEQPRFVETLPRRGYRFIAPVTKNGFTEAAVPEQSYPPSAAAAVDHSPATSSVQSLTPRWPRQFVVIGILASLLILAFVAVSTWLWPSRRQTLSFENLEITKLTDSGAVKNVAISHDGRYVAYAVYIGERQALRLRQVATRSDMELLPPDAGNFVGLTFSPDGNYIYFVRSDRNDISFRYLYVVPSLGGTPRKLITDVDSGIGFSPDGRKIVYEHSIRNEMEVKTANADGTDQQLLAVVHDANFLTPGDPGPTWSPDGRTITFSKLLVGQPRRWVLFAVSAQDGRIRELYSPNAAIGRPVWLPSGDTILVPQYDRISNRTQLWTVSFPSGAARRFTHDISDYSMDLDLTNDGRTLAAITGAVQSQIWAGSFPVDTRSMKQITNGDPPIGNIKQMPDSKILATDSDGALLTMNQDGSQRATFGNFKNVTWFTACGRYVVATTNEPNSTALVRFDSDGTRVVTLATGNLWSPTCSVEGRFVFYVNWEEPQKIWRISIDGGSPVEVVRILGDCIMGNVTVSPDGKYIAYPYTAYTGTTPGRHLAVIPASGGSPLKQFDMQGDSWGVGPYWTSNSTALRYLQLRDGVSNVWEQPLSGGEPRQLTRFTSGRIFDFAWSENEKRLFLTRGSASSDVVLLTGFH